MFEPAVGCFLGTHPRWRWTETYLPAMVTQFGMRAICERNGRSATPSAIPEGEYLLYSDLTVELTEWRPFWPAADFPCWDG